MGYGQSSEPDWIQTMFIFHVNVVPYFIYHGIQSCFVFVFHISCLCGGRCFNLLRTVASMGLTLASNSRKDRISVRQSEGVRKKNLVKLGVMSEIIAINSLVY